MKERVLLAPLLWGLFLCGLESCSQSQTPSPARSQTPTPDTNQTPIIANTSSKETSTELILFEDLMRSTSLDGLRFIYRLETPDNDHSVVRREAGRMILETHGNKWMNLIHPALYHSGTLSIKYSLKKGNFQILLFHNGFFRKTADFQTWESNPKQGVLITVTNLSSSSQEAISVASSNATGGWTAEGEPFILPSCQDSECEMKIRFDRVERSISISRSPGMTDASKEFKISNALEDGGFSLASSGESRSEFSAIRVSMESKKQLALYDHYTGKFYDLNTGAQAGAAPGGSIDYAADPQLKSMLGPTAVNHTRSGFPIAFDILRELSLEAVLDFPTPIDGRTTGDMLQDYTIMQPPSIVLGVLRGYIVRDLKRSPGTTILRFFPHGALECHPSYFAAGGLDGRWLANPIGRRGREEDGMAEAQCWIDWTAFDLGDFQNFIKRHRLPPGVSITGYAGDPSNALDGSMIRFVDVPFNNYATRTVFSYHPNLYRYVNEPFVELPLTLEPSLGPTGFLGQTGPGALPTPLALRDKDLGLMELWSYDFLNHGNNFHVQNIGIDLFNFPSQPSNASLLTLSPKLPMTLEELSGRQDYQGDCNFAVSLVQPGRVLATRYNFLASAVRMEMAGFVFGNLDWSHTDDPTGPHLVFENRVLFSGNFSGLQMLTNSLSP